MNQPLATIPVARLTENGLVPDLSLPATYVLVIDDEPLIADTLVQIFRNEGFAALAAYDGESALENAKVAPPQVVIADIRLPGMSGIDVAIAIEESIPDARAVLLSGHADTADLNAARARGHEFPLITKPIHPELLLRIVRDLARNGSARVGKRDGAR